MKETSDQKDNQHRRLPISVVPDTRPNEDVGSEGKLKVKCRRKMQVPFECNQN